MVRARDIHVVDSSSSPGQQTIVSVEADVNGDENGFGFTLNYDPTKLSAPLVSAGTGAQGTFLIPNTNTPGKVGVILPDSASSARWETADRKFLTDGKRIFFEAIEQTAGEPRLIDVLRKQYVFSDIVKPALFTGIEYGDDGARRWFPVLRRKAIVLDPALQFGTPVLAGAGIATDTIHASFLAEGRDRAMVARVFDISPDLVTAAVEFEESLPA